MKNPIFNTLKAFSACALLAVSCLSAQSGSRIIVNVPFDFVARNQHLAAGTYSVTTNLTQGTVLIRGEDNGSATFALTIATQADQVQPCAKLVFNRYGDRYFLSQVWHAGTDRGRMIPASKAEQEMAMSTAKPAIVALLASGPKPGRAVH
jgi:hypothetical protein